MALLSLTREITDMPQTIKSVSLVRYDDNYENNVIFMLEEGNNLEFNSGGQTEEGYDYTNEVWSFDGEWVTLEIYRDARDCDGSLRNNTTLYWNSWAGEKTDKGHPIWIDESAYRRIENEG